MSTERTDEAGKLHAKYSASGAKRWLECPGSISLSEQAPEPTESRYAKEGTRAHEVLEYLLKNRAKRLSASSFLKKSHPLEMVLYAEEVLKYVEKRLSKLDGAELFIEVKADLPVSEEGQFGTADIVIVEHFGKLIVLDYKYGAGIPVYPENNPQLLYYALAVAHKFDYNFAEVEVVIIQPRAVVSSGETTRSWTTTIDHLLAWRDRFESGILRAKDAAKAPEKFLKAGDHCRFCPAKIMCPEIKNKALREAQADFDDDTGEIELPALNSRNGGYHPAFTPEVLSRTLPALEKLEVWIAGVREIATQVLERGGKIPGWALVEKRGSRKWLDESKAAKLAGKKFGDRAFTKPELLSPAQLEKLNDKAKAFVAEYSATVSSGLTLGRDKAALDFEEKGGKVKDSVKTKNRSRKSRK